MANMLNLETNHSVFSRNEGRKRVLCQAETIICLALIRQTGDGTAIDVSRMSKLTPAVRPCSRISDDQRRRTGMRRSSNAIVFMNPTTEGRDLFDVGTDVAFAFETGCRHVTHLAENLPLEPGPVVQTEHPAHAGV